MLYFERKAFYCVKDLKPNTLRSSETLLLWIIENEAPEPTLLCLTFKVQPCEGQVLLCPTL